MPKKTLNIIELVNNNGCFDLQFRKDTRHERTNSPTYYRWKVQFVITAPKENTKVLEKVKREFGCGSVSTTNNQSRFSIQKINEIIDTIVPFFKKHRLIEKKNKDFNMWQRAVEIIYRNKGIYLTKWKKSDLNSLMEIHRSSAKYKNKSKESKWIQMAKSLTKTT